MKIAISSTNGNPKSPFSSRFGRCDYFVFYDTETQKWESKPNPAASGGGGAGTFTVQFLSNSGVGATISGRYGPNAFSALKAAGIKAFEASSGTPEELVEKYLAGKLTQVGSATGPGLHR